MSSTEKKSKKKLKLYNPEVLEKDEQDVPYIAAALTDIIKYLFIYILLLIFTFFSLIFFIVNSILFYVLFSAMTVKISIFLNKKQMNFLMKLCELFEKIKKRISQKMKKKYDQGLRPIKRNISNENFKKMKRMEKSAEYLGEKKFNLFFEIKNVLVFFVDKKKDADVHELNVFFYCF